MRRRRPLLPFRGLCGKGEAWGAAGVKEAGTPPMGNAGEKENAPHNVRCAIWERQLALGWAAKGARCKGEWQGKRKSLSWNADAF